MSMRGIERSFWLLVAGLVAVEGLLVYLALQSLTRVLPCWWAFIPNPGPAHTSCGESVAIFGYNSWVPGTLVLVFAIATGIVGLGTLGSQILRTSMALRRLPSPITNTPQLAEIEATDGVNIALVPDERCFCCCAGYLKPRIIISSAMLDILNEDQLAAVLAHETAHAKRRDPARAVAVRVAANMMCYFPLARTLARRSLVASEIGADDWAASAVGHTALVGALASVIGRIRPALGSASELSALDSLDVRIEALRTGTLPKARLSLAIVAASVVALACLWGLSHWFPPLPTHVVYGHFNVVVRHKP
jgi:hypothetical protein